MRSLRLAPVQADIVEVITTVAAPSPPEPPSVAKPAWQLRPLGPFQEYQTLFIVFCIGLFTACIAILANSPAPPPPAPNKPAWYVGSWDGGSMTLTFRSMYSAECISELDGHDLVQRLSDMELRDQQLLFTVEDDARSKEIRPPRQYLFVQSEDEPELASLYRLDPNHWYSFDPRQSGLDKAAVIPRWQGAGHVHLAKFSRKGQANAD
jgi:hypothetical protein